MVGHQTEPLRSICNAACRPLIITTPCLICCPAGSFKRRKRKSIVVTALLLVVSVLILVFGLAATTRTQNITVGGYYPGVIVSAGSP